MAAMASSLTLERIERRELEGGDKGLISLVGSGVRLDDRRRRAWRTTAEVPYPANLVTTTCHNILSQHILPPIW